MAEVFPDDIQEQILVRLKVKDLTRFKSVSKSWLSLISGSRFVKNHLVNRNNNTIRCIRICMSAIAICSAKRKACGFIFDPKCYMIGSSNGLVCVNSSDDHILLVNPIIREVEILQNPSSRCRCYMGFGFGYDLSIDDYKLLFGFKEHGTKQNFKLLHLKSNIWKPIKLVKDLCFVKGRVGILCNGALHWLVHDNQADKLVILSFDLSKEEFKIIPQPDDNPAYQYSWQCRLGVTEEGCLCIFHGFIDQMWVMKSYNVKQSWGPERVKDMDYLNNMECLQMKLSSPNDNLNITFFMSSYLTLNSPIFLESLVSPHTLVSSSNMNNQFIWQEVLKS